MCVRLKEKEGVYKRQGDQERKIDKAQDKQGAMPIVVEDGEERRGEERRRKRQKSRNK